MIFQPQSPIRQLLFQGAEARVYKITLSSTSLPFIHKQRLPKLYRHPQLDKKITKQRVKSVPLLLLTYKLNLPVPKVQKLIPESNTIVMEYLSGIKLKDWFNSPQTQLNLTKQLLKMGFLIFRFHEQGIIHGDLTTSNMIFKDNKIYLIDFGLSHIKNMAESKAVDLYVLERAFVSTHPRLEEMFKVFYEGYGDQEVIRRLDKGKIEIMQLEKEEERKQRLGDMYEVMQRYQILLISYIKQIQRLWQTSRNKMNK